MEPSRTKPREIEDVPNSPLGDRAAASWILLSFLFVWLSAAYLPDLGKGFILDDFAWLIQAHVADLRDLLRIFTTSTGFYRPLVTLSFALDRAAFGLHPFAYGLTNFVLLLLCAGGVVRLGRALGLPTFVGLLAATLWCMNPKGITVALLWVSGRTALLLTLFAVLAATSLLKNHPWSAAVFTFLAMLSKEEALVLAGVLLVWAWVQDGQQPSDGAKGSGRRPSVVCRLWPVLPVVLPYLLLRFISGAYWPGTAPPEYRLSFNWHVVAVNVVEYLDRAAMLSISVSVLLSLLLWKGNPPALSRADRTRIKLGLVWLVGGYALTVFLPGRTSLYACLPSVGVALICSIWIGGLVRHNRSRAIWVLPGLAVVAIAALPIYWIRNQRLVVPATVSSVVLGELQRVAPELPQGSTVVLRDRPPGRDNIASALGTLLPEALKVATKRTDLQIWLDPPPPNWRLAGWRQPDAGDKVIILAFRGNQLVRLQP
jgi:hypothetical protein